MSKKRSKTYRIAAAAFLLALLAWVGVHLSEVDRSGDSPESNEPSGTAGVSYFDLLRSAREHVRSSGGHYAAEYDRLIEAGEPDDLIRFIRARFVVVPGGQNTGWRNAIRDRRWGTEATLRGGAGTPRELADLLADGIRRMGHEAVVVAVDSPLPRRDFSLREPPPLIEFDSEALRDAFSAKPLVLPGPMPDSESFWQTAYATIPPGDIDVETFDNSESRFPSVRFVRDGVAQVANLWGANAELTLDAPATIESRWDLQMTWKLDEAFDTRAGRVAAEGQRRSDDIALHAGEQCGSRRRSASCAGYQLAAVELRPGPCRARQRL